MLLGKSVLSTGSKFRRTVFALIDRDRLLTCSGVTGKRERGYRVILGDNAACDQRIYQTDKTGCIAARNRDTVT